MTNLFAKYKKIIYQKSSEIRDVPVPQEKPSLVNITNVNHWFWNQPQDDFDDLDEFIVRLPWEVCWFEFSDPKNYMRGGKRKTFKGPTIHHGVLAYYNEDTQRNYYHLFMLNNQFDAPHLPPLIYMGRKSESFNEHGNPLGDNDLHLSPIAREILQSLGDRQAMANNFNRAFAPMEFALTFAHCKNVDYYDKNLPQQVERARLRKGKTPQETYKILDIGGLTRQAKEKSEGTGMSERSQALHICRGHFKTYTEENPLFGKHTGKYWCPMHRRGSAEAGTSNKDYRINPS